MFENQVFPAQAVLGSQRLWPNIKLSFRSTISCLSSRNSHIIALGQFFGSWEV